MCEFCHLHLHTEYSLLDGLNRSYKLLEKVKNDGMDSVAVTDHGVMYGIPEFWVMSKDYNIKPIIGCEIYLAPGDMTLKKDIDGIKYYHLLLIAKNKTGYINLNKIVSEAQINGYYYKPRIDKETLKKYSEGLIVTSACLAGPISRHILRGQEATAIEWLEFFKNTFKDNFFLEVQRNGFNVDDITKVDLRGIHPEYRETIEHQIKVNNKLREYADKYKLPLLATTDAHFLNKEDNETQEILFAIKDGKRLDDDERRIGYLDTYVKTQEEMKTGFSDLPEALENSMKISEMVEKFDIRFDRVQPHFYDVPKGKTTQDVLKEKVYSGAKRKYGEITTELDERLQYELKVIHDKGYDDYFLVVWDIMNFAHRNGIVMGVRGSVAGSVVAYCLDIIAVEPIVWELYFERFLNPERPSPPDIDMDIQDDRRDEVITYVAETYGHENVAAICAVGRMKTKAAIRDISRVMGIDLKIADKLSKMVHVKFGKVKKIGDMMNDDSEFADIVNSSPDLIRMKGYVEKIEGMARHMSTHACGHLITPTPITDYVSVQKENGGERTITQNEGVWIEELGLMKFDFLGLRNLTILKNTLNFIKEYRDIDIKIEDIPLDDKKTFELFTRGETIGVFQFESPPMQRYLKDLKPENLEDICFMVSAYRPGPMQYIPDYIKRKHGEQEPTYLIPEMEPILKNTFGFAIYQEQVIKIAVDIAGYSMGQADLLRRAMGKKKIDIMNKEEPKFKDGVKAKGYDDDIAQQIWNYLLPFADYGFNKAHGAGYSLVAYWCAYLKAHYAIEFMAGLLHSDLKDNDRIVVDIQELKRMGFELLPPDVNKSDKYFSIEGKSAIRFGLGAIKNVSEKSIEHLIEERNANGDYTSLDNLIERVGSKNINKKTLECLAMVGAFDAWGRRSQLLKIVPEVWTRTSKDEVQASGGQGMLFSSMDNKKVSLATITPLPNTEEETKLQKVAWEKDLIGIYVTEHPLGSYENLIYTKSVQTIKDSKELGEGQDVQILVTINNIKNLKTKKDGKSMAILSIEDFEDKAEAVVFPKSYEKVSEKIEEFVPLIIKGKVNFRDDKLSLIVNNIISPEETEEKKKITINIIGVNDKNQLNKLKEYIVKNPGETELEVIYGSIYEKKSLIKKITPSQEFMDIAESFIIKS